MTKLPKLVFLGALASSIALGASAYAQGSSHVQGWNTGNQNQTVKVSDTTSGNPWDFHQWMADWENYFKHIHLDFPHHHHHHHVGPPGGSVNPGGGDDQGGNGQGDNNNDQ